MFKTIIMVSGGIILWCLALILLSLILGVAGLAIDLTVFLVGNFIVPAILLYILYRCVRFLKG